MPVVASAAPDVRIERVADGYAVHVRTDIAADAAIAWQVLTDYNHLAEFVPDMQTSRVVSAKGAPLQVEQKGSAGFLLFKLSIDVVLEVEETPPIRMVFRVVRGNMRRMHGEWRIDPSAHGIALVYEAELEPAFWTPPLIGPAIMRRDVASQVAGVVREIERRQLAATSRQKAAVEK